MFLDITHVSKSYGAVKAVDDCSIEVGIGEFVTLLGPSGCGKTTTLRMVAGFVSPDAGEIRLDGATLSSPSGGVPPEKRQIGMVFQSYAVWPHMSVRSNVALPLKLRGFDRVAIERRVKHVLGLCRLEGLEARAPHELSGGQLQRVALARALVYEPRLVLLDEPLSNLDVTLRESLREEIRRVHKETGTTFVLVTHDQIEAMSLSDRIVVMNAGHIEQAGTPEAVYRAPQTEFVARFVGGANILRGTAVAVLPGGESGRCRVDVQGWALEVSGWKGAVAGEAVTLAVHPESIRILGEGAPSPGGGGVEGVVRTSAFMGRMQEINVAVGSEEIRVVQVSGPTYRPGERVRMVVAPRSAIPIGQGAANIPAQGLAGVRSA